MIYQPRLELSEAERKTIHLLWEISERRMLEDFMQLNRVLFFEAEQSIITHWKEKFEKNYAKTVALRHYGRFSE